MNTVIKLFMQKARNIFILTLSVIFADLQGFAQDKKLDIDIDIDKDPVWYQQPWAWVVGAGIFILILVAILRGGRKK